MGFKIGHKSYLTDESRKKMSETRKGKMPKNIELLNRLAKNKSPEWVKKFSKTKTGQIRLNMRGEKHFNWKGGITSLVIRIRHCYKYRQWRSDVFTRDNFTCQECGEKNGSGKSIYLEAHHIKEFYKIIEENNIKTIDDSFNCEELWNINNGITFCDKCHNKTKNGRK